MKYLGCDVYTSFFYLKYIPLLLQNKNHLTFAYYPGSMWNSSKACPKKSSKTLFCSQPQTSCVMPAVCCSLISVCCMRKDSQRRLAQTPQTAITNDYWGFSSPRCLMPSTQAEALLIQRDVNLCGIEITACTSQPVEPVTARACTQLNERHSWKCNKKRSYLKWKKHDDIQSKLMMEAKLTVC